MMIVPYNELSRIHKPLSESFHQCLDKVLISSSFVGHSPEFVDTFTTYTGSSHCIPCNSGTDALYLAIKSLQLSPGSRIAVPAMTFAATAMSVVNAGHVPVFIDVDSQTGLMLVDTVPPNCDCVIPVHLYGQCVDVNPLFKLGIPVIEDCAQAHGATINGKHVGTLGTIGCFSFYPGKNLGALGDAGACITNDNTLAKRMTQISKLGANPDNRYDHQTFGIKSTIDHLQSLFLVEKLKYLDKWTEQRIDIGKYYSSNIPDSINRSTVGKDVYHVFYTLQDDRDAYIKYMNEKGVQTNIQYPTSLPELTCFKEFETDCPNAREFSRKCVSIPIFPEMTTDEVRFTLDCHTSYRRNQELYTSRRYSNDYLVSLPI